MAFEVVKTFVVHAPTDTVWAFLTAPNRVARCLPGAAITSQVDDRTYPGTMTVKVGRVTTSYKGRVVFERLDAALRFCRGRATDARCRVADPVLGAISARDDDRRAGPLLRERHLHGRGRTAFERGDSLDGEVLHDHRSLAHDLRGRRRPYDRNDLNRRDPVQGWTPRSIGGATTRKIEGEAGREAARR